MWNQLPAHWNPFRSNAKKKSKQHRAARNRARRALMEPLEERTVFAVDWSNVGPSTIENGQVQNLGNNQVAGAVQAIAPYFNNADIIYIGTTNGGVFKTTNATAATPHWTPLT